MKKKICFIAQFPPPIHGLSKAIDTLYNSKLKDEFEFEKVDITNNKKFIKNIIAIFKSNADLFYFTISQTKGGNLRDLIILKLLEKQHKKCLIHLHGGYYRRLVDNDLSKWQKKANYSAIRKLDGVIVLGESLKYIFEGMIYKNKIFTVPNCVDDEFLLDEDEFENKLKNIENKKEKNVLYLSNFIKEKGYEYVLELAKLEKENFDKTGKKKFHFHFAGKFFNEKDKKDFLNYVNENNLNDFITYHGIVNGKEKHELLKKSDIFILLTTYPKEGQPISILEAMGNGMIIVTTNHAGIPDVVKNNDNGIVISNKKNIKELYNKITTFSNKYIKDICKENRLKVIKKYSQKMYISSMKKIFIEVSINEKDKKNIIGCFQKDNTTD